MDEGAPGASREEKFAFEGLSASGYARQHNGNVYSNTNYHYTVRKRRSDETLRENGRDEALLLAAANGHTARVNYLLRLGADIDHADEKGLTALHQAAYSGWEDTTEALISHGANLEALSEDWGTALHLAACKGRASIIDLLLRRRAKTNVSSRRLGTPLHCASCIGDLEGATSLLRAGADADALAQVWLLTQKATLIHFGPSFHFELLTPDCWEHQEYKMWVCHPIMLAVDKPAPFVRLLAEKTSRLDATCLWNSRPILASESLDGYSWQPGHTPLSLAAQSGHLHSVRELLRKGADCNALACGDWTALLIAARNGFLDICEELLLAGADTEKPLEDRRTPLKLAARYNHADCVKLLLRHNAFITDKVLNNAAYFCAPESMEVLLRHRPSLVNTTNHSGDTLLHTVAEVAIFNNRDEAKRIELTRLLFECGVNPLAKSNVGETALDRFQRLRIEKNKANRLPVFYALLKRATEQAERDRDGR